MGDKLRALEAERDQLAQKPQSAFVLRMVRRLRERIERYIRDLRRVARQHPEQARMYLR